MLRKGSGGLVRTLWGFKQLGLPQWTSEHIGSWLTVSLQSAKTTAPTATPGTVRDPLPRTADTQTDDRRLPARPRAIEGL